MVVEISPRQYSIRVYDQHDTNYVATAQLCVYGDRCWIYGIHGNQFYNAVQDILEQVHGLGIHSIEGYVSPAHARLIRMNLQHTDNWSLTLGKKGVMHGHELVWVHITYEENTNGE